MGRTTTTKIPKVLTGILSGLAFLCLYSFAFAATEPSPEKIGQDITSEISNLFMIAGIGFAIITVLVIGFRLSIVKNSEEAAKTYEWLKYVIIGSIILAILSSVIGIVVGFEEEFYKIFELPKTNTPPAAQDTANVEDVYEEKWYTKLIAGIFELVYRFFTWVGKVVGFKPVDQLIFNESAFTADQFKFMLSFYWLVTLVATAFIVVMIGKTAVQLIATGYSARKRADLMEEIYTWFEVIIFIAVYPLMFVYLMKFFDSLTSWLFRYVQLEYAYLGDSNFANSNVDTLVGQIKTTNPLNTAIVKAMYGYMYFKLNMIFLVRRLVLGVFFLFAPVAAAMWGIKKDSNVMNVWVGEVITNASMGFFYGFALLAVLHLVNSLNMSGWFFSLISMWMLPQIGGTLRNMLQNWFQRASGIDEERAVSPFFTGVFPMIKGSTTSLAHALSGGKIGTVSFGSKAETGSSSSTTSSSNTNTTSNTSARVSSPAGSISSATQSSAGSRFHPAIENAQNIYSETNATRTAFLQNLGALADKGISGAAYNLGNVLHSIGDKIYHDNPSLAMLTNVTGHVLKTVSGTLGGGFKISAAINYSTLQRMTNSDQYREQMRKLAPVANFLTQKGKGDMLAKAIITGKTDELVTFINNTPVNERGELSAIPVDFVETIQQLHNAFKEERKVTEKQLGISGVHSKIWAATKFRDPEKFTEYFYKKHPYAKATDAFIFKV